ncbi:MAG: hypothetical protein OEX14_03960 [Paracoccaceae bacterium]|nr:hypothetical protein [Paracoccaceae bacterium]
MTCPSFALSRSLSEDETRVIRQHWAGKARSLLNGRWLKRALGAAQIRDRSKATEGEGMA